MRYLFTPVRTHHHALTRDLAMFFLNNAIAFEPSNFFLAPHQQCATILISALVHSTATVLGKKMVVLVGQTQALQQAVRNTQRVRRFTMLSERLAACL